MPVPQTAPRACEPVHWGQCNCDKAYFHLVVDQAGNVVFAGMQGPRFHKPTSDFDPRLNGVPSNFSKMPGYSNVSLDDFLKRMPRNKRP